MPKREKPEPTSPWDSEVRLLAWLATCVSILAFLFYFRHGEVLLYGDAIAHVNIARRVFDSKTPGLLQLGTVWLPLPHVLMIPFLISDRMWQSGAGGSIPSMVGYVFGVIGIFRLLRSALSGGAEKDSAARLAAWGAALVFAANPNLIYLQSTAMGEAFYLAFFIWAVVHFTDWVRGDLRALTKCGWCLAAACFSRYDGWLLAAAMLGTAVVLHALKQRSDEGVSAKNGSTTPLLKFILIAVAAPALWLAYNGVVYRNPMEFANGPYSAKAIERRSQASGNHGHPGSDNPVLAEMYFVKSAEANVAQNKWSQRAWILLALAAIAGSVLLLPRGRRPSTFLFLLIPLGFYTLSIAYGGVPIFVPAWWPFSHYNVRYGLQLLPVFAAVIGISIYLPMRAQGLSWRPRLGVGAALFAFIVASYASIWNATPITLKEAQINMRTRNQLQMEVARWVEHLPADSTLLMYLGDHVGVLERANFSLKRTINEGNHRVWKQPTDPEGLWEQSLANPSQHVDFVIAFEGDPVWQAVHSMRLQEIVDLHVSGQPRAVLFRARESAR